MNDEKKEKMECKEFLGIGRTWLGIYLLIALMGAMVFTGHLEVELFLKQSGIFMLIGGGKSTAEKISNAFGRK